MSKVLEVNVDDLYSGGVFSLLKNVIINRDSTINIDIAALEKFEKKENLDILAEHNCKVHYVGCTGNKILKQLKIYKNLKSLIETETYDCIHIHADVSNKLLISGLAAKRAGARKIILHSHASGVDGKYRKMKLLIHKVCRCFLKYIGTDFVACSDLAAFWMFKNISLNHITIINNGVDLEKFRFNVEMRYEMRKKLNIRDNELVIGHVGRFAYQKNHEYLVTLFSALKLIRPDASSIGNMTDEELNVIIKDINAFDYVSMREKVSSARLEQLLHKSIKTVLDPTFLLKNNEWISKLKLHKKEEEKYILYYSLLGIKPLKQMAQILKIVAQNKKAKLRIITPFAYLNINDEVIEIHPEYGPIEFLESIYNAQAVYTNSYHGTILSVNLNKDIYSLCEDSGTEFRKTDILKRLGLADRIIYDPLVLLQDNFKPIDYDDVNKKISNYREDSILYLKNALS